MGLRATEVFVPSDFPVHTYVKREDENLERRLADAIDTPKSTISISGPSKSGKTALVQNVVGEGCIVPVYGAQISSPDDLWDAILNWIEAPASTTESSGSSESFTPTAKVSAKAKIPGFAEVSAGGGVAASKAANSNSSATRENRGLAAVAREIADSDYIVFLDDFHYIHRDLQENIGQQIKAGAEAGIRFCIASVPHRSDDVVRSNHELRGRTTNVDTSYWSDEDLVKIGLQGFEALKAKIDIDVLARLARESCTSPQIMQALCLQLCFDINLREANPTEADYTIDQKAVRKVLEQTSTKSDYTSLLKQMHAGPRIRGTERKEFAFVDGSNGDAYRAVLLAIAADPPSMEFNYADLTARITAICQGDKPIGSSVSESYKQIHGFAQAMYPNQRIVEWDPDAAGGTFAIIDPYFCFS